MNKVMGDSPVEVAGIDSKTYLQSLLEGIEVKGGGNAEFQGGKVSGSAPIGGGVSAFAKTGIQNNPYSGFSVGSPEVGLKYKGTAFDLQGSYQNNAPVDRRVHGYDAPSGEKMYKMKMNIPCRYWWLMLGIERI